MNSEWAAMRWKFLIYYAEQELTSLNCYWLYRGGAVQCWSWFKLLDVKWWSCLYRAVTLTVLQRVLSIERCGLNLKQVCTEKACSAAPVLRVFKTGNEATGVTLRFQNARNLDFLVVCCKRLDFSHLEYNQLTCGIHYSSAGASCSTRGVDRNVLVGISCEIYWLIDPLVTDS
jgi:hypothetical protein